MPFLEKYVMIRGVWKTAPHKFSVKRVKERVPMKKVICKVEYDTEAAELLQKRSVGCYGDPAGYEECLFRMPDGKMFLYMNGGEESPYPEETIKRISAAKADEWMAENK